MWRAQIVEFNQNLSCPTPHLFPVVTGPSLLTHPQPSSHSNQAKCHRNHEHSHYVMPPGLRKDPAVTQNIQCLWQGGGVALIQTK